MPGITLGVAHDQMLYGLENDIIGIVSAALDHKNWDGAPFLKINDIVQGTHSDFDGKSYLEIAREFNAHKVITWLEAQDAEAKSTLAAASALRSMRFDPFPAKPDPSDEDRATPAAPTL